ncbi:Mu transposase C-terminal domain-containing protein [Streptomyces odonnellii]|uniref:Mu transposase C-terminal domain-containing protein n=1 Tax=Streptomyces odonnellii TaxID=1417980 RepID=UPI0012FF4807|nr:Mu transposase C-terminal domain-containing protein [Streptomyces odonnellii]
MAGFARGLVQLADPLGDAASPSVEELALSADFEVLEQGPRVRSVRVLPATKEILEQARWWEQHITEVISGLPLGSAPDAMPRSEYDPASRSLSQREAAKAAELTAAGMSGASARTVRRRRQRYQADGIDGLIDGRAVRERAPGVHQDPRVLDVLLTLMAEEVRQRGTTSAEAYRRSVGRMLDMRYGIGAVPLPSRSTFQRLVKMIRNQHGDARGITLIDKNGIRLSRPGERVLVDTFELPLPSHLADPSLRSVRMTVAIDELTHTICTLMVHLPHDGVDAPTLLARLCGPPALRTAYGSGEERAAVPLILPETLVLDGSRMRRGREFLNECRALGIRIEKRRPVEKAGGERIASRLVTLFSAELTALTGDTSHDDVALISWLQDRAERWVESVWQHQPQWKLQATGGRRRHATPSSAYEACVARLGWVHLPLGRQARLRLLPSVTRQVTEGGVFVKGHRYFHVELASLRSTRPVEVRFDPYDLRQVWVRTRADVWLQAPLVIDTLGQPPSRQARGATSARRRSLPDAPARKPSAELDSVQQRLSYHAQLPILRTPFLQEALRLSARLALLNRTTAGGRQGLLITGPPRSGKTTALQELGRHFAHATIAGVPLGQAAYLRIHPADSDRTALLRLGKRIGLPPHPGRMSTVAASEAVQEALMSSKTGLVLVDDAFPETPTSSISNPVEALSFLADQVPALFVYASSDTAGNPLAPTHEAGQGRLARVQATPVPYGPDWQCLVESLDEALCLRRHQPGSLLRLAPALHHRTGGWAGALAHLVRSACIDAILSGREEITEQDVRSIAV